MDCQSVLAIHIQFDLFRLNSIKSCIMAKMVCNLFGTLVQFITESLELILYSNQASRAQTNKPSLVFVDVDQFLYVKSYIRLFQWPKFILRELERTIFLQCWVSFEYNFGSYVISPTDTTDQYLYPISILPTCLLSFSQFMRQSSCCCCVIKCVYSFIFNKLAIKL